MDAKYLAEIKAREQAAKDVLAKAELRYDTEYRPLLEAISDIPALLAEVERQDQQIATLKKALELACEDMAEGCSWDDASAEDIEKVYLDDAQEQEAEK